MGNQTFNVLGAVHSTRNSNNDTIKTSAIQSAKQSKAGDISGETLILSKSAMEKAVRDIEHTVAMLGANGYVKTKVVDNKPIISEIGFREQPKPKAETKVIKTDSGLYCPAPPPKPLHVKVQEKIDSAIYNFVEGGAEVFVNTGKGLYQMGKDVLHGDTTSLPSFITHDQEKARQEAQALIDDFNNTVDAVKSGDTDAIAKSLGGIVIPALVTRGLEKGIGVGIRSVPDVDVNLDPNVGRVGGVGNVQTGGREMSLKEYARQEAEATKMYDNIRASTTDVQEISKNTGVSESRVQRIKDHVFNNEHIKSSGNGKFDPDYEIAQAWQRLQTGTHNPEDINLLNHEIFESKFEGIFKTDYETAHSASEKSGRVWRP